MAYQFRSSNIIYEIQDVCGASIAEFHINKNSLEEEVFIIFTTTKCIDKICKALTSADISYDVYNYYVTIRRNEEKLTIEDVLSAFDDIKI